MKHSVKPRAHTAADISIAQQNLDRCLEALENNGEVGLQRELDRIYPETAGMRPAVEAPNEEFPLGVSGLSYDPATKEFTLQVSSLAELSLTKGHPKPGIRYGENPPASTSAPDSVASKPGSTGNPAA